MADMSAEPIEPNHSQQSNTLQCLHYVLLTVSGKCGTKLCGGLAFQYSIILKLNWVWGLYGSRNLLTIVIGGKVVLGGIIYFFLRGGKISDPIEATLSPQCEAAAVLVAVGQFSLILSPCSNNTISIKIISFFSSNINTCVTSVIFYNREKSMGLCCITVKAMKLKINWSRYILK